MMKLDDALAGVTRLGIDTAPLIYFITLTEVLVQPLRMGNPVLAQRYRHWLSRSRNLSLLPLSASSP